MASEKPFIIVFSRCWEAIHLRAQNYDMLDDRWLRSTKGNDVAMIITNSLYHYHRLKYVETQSSLMTEFMSVNCSYQLFSTRSSFLWLNAIARTIKFMPLHCQWGFSSKFKGFLKKNILFLGNECYIQKCFPLLWADIAFFHVNNC